MKIFNIISFLGRNIEKETISLLKEHLDKTYATVGELNAVFDAIEKKDSTAFLEKQKNVASLESEADRFRRKIEKNLYSGAFLPVSRGRILNFAERVDAIADAAEDATKVLMFLKGDHTVPKIPKKIFNSLRIQLNYGMDAVGILKKCVEDTVEPDEIVPLIREIRAYEAKSDLVEHEAYLVLYSGKYGAKSLILFSELITAVSEISDRAEDASDTLSSIVLSYKA